MFSDMNSFLTLRMDLKKFFHLLVYLAVTCIARYNCFDSMITYLGQSSTHQTSYTKYTSWNSESRGIISFSFITSNPNGLLLHVGDSNKTEWTRNYLELSIQNGMLNFLTRVKNGTKFVKWKRAWYVKDVDDLRWHSVQIRRDGINVLIQLDGEQILVQFGVGDMPPIKLTGAMYIGGIPQSGSTDCRADVMENGFVGAIKDVRYGPGFDASTGYERILLKPGTLWGYQDHCAKTPRQINLCQNRGICINKFNNYSCDCLGTGFEGRNCSTVSTPLHFKGLDYVEWKPLLSQRSQEANEIALRFKTLEPSGILIYIGNSTNYLVIELYRGHLVVGLRLDAASEKLTLIASNVTLNNDQWHLVQVSRRELNLKVSVNRTNTTQSRAFGNSLRRHLKDSKLYVGGRSYLRWLPGTLSKNFFMGCLQQIYYNGENVISSIIKSYRTKNSRRTKHGNVVKGCPKRVTKAPFTRAPRSKRYRPTFTRQTNGRTRNSNMEKEPSKRSRVKTINTTSQTMLVVGIILGVIVLFIVISATIHYLRSRYRQELALTAIYTKPQYEHGTSSGTMSMYISPSSSGEKSDKVRGIVQ